MKKYLFIVTSILLILLYGCRKNYEIISTPSNVAGQLLKLLNYDGSKSEDTYSEFLQLFHNQTKENISLDMYENLKSLSLNRASLSTIELIRYGDGRILLVNFYPEPINGEYKIIDIKVIPEEIGNMLNKYINE